MSKMNEKAIILPYRDTSLTSEEPMAEISSQKIQIAVLDMIAAISSNKRSAVALESVLKKVCGLVVGIAYSSLTGLQEAAIRALAGLACIDADLIWFSWRMCTTLLLNKPKGTFTAQPRSSADIRSFAPSNVFERIPLCTVWR